jgi:hypothetical protein
VLRIDQFWSASWTIVKLRRSRQYTGNPANLTNQQQWMGLCELASNEHDQEKLGALFEGILRLLEDQQARLSISADGKPHDTPVLNWH